MEKEVEKIFIEHMCSAAGMAPSALAVAAKLSASTLNRHTKDDVKVSHKLSIDSLRKISQTLGVPVTNLIDHREKILKAIKNHEPIPEPRELKVVIKESSLQPRIAEPIEHAQFGPDTVPLLGHVKTSSGTVIMGKEIGRALRHPNQQGRTDGYAIEVWDNTMGPRYAIGERAYPAKEKHPTEGQDCYIFFNNGEVVLRKFISKTDKDIIFEQLNPPKKFKRLLTDVQDVHAVLGRG